MMVPPVERLGDLIVCIKGAGDVATGIAARLYYANIRRIYMLENSAPLAVRRTVAFSDAVYEGRKTVEDITAVLAGPVGDIPRIWQEHAIAVRVDPQWRSMADCPPHVVVDAILAKKNLGTVIREAPLVVGLGPGFEAGKDVHMAVETQRGHDLGRVLTRGRAAANTGIPGNIGGYTIERILRSPATGRFIAQKFPGDDVAAGDVVARVDTRPVIASIGGVLRGLMRDGTMVTKGLKIGDIDPRGDAVACHRISDKSRALGGAVLEAILRVYNR
ncbi:MAG: selenium-dependent molybdenum cofactor biosynthesis protein YqeB [Desulfobacterales bacterium]